MDQQHDGQEQEQEQDESQQEEIIAGLSAHAEATTTKKDDAATGAQPGGATAGIQGSAEHGATGGASPGVQAAPGAIDATATANATKAWERRDKTRQTEQKQRLAHRAGSAQKPKADWTAEELAACQKKDGPQGVLVALNERKPKSGIDLLKAAGKWDAFLTSLPKGKLTHWAAKATDQMVADSLFTLDEMIKLFEIRFNHPALGVSSGANNAKAWSFDTMIVVWRQLALLPANDVTLNSAIASFRAISGGGAFGPAWNDASINTVDMGQDNGDAQHLEHTVRHEIGHGVHAQIKGEVNPWLQNDMKFWFTDFDKFINDLGGYPASFVNPAGGGVVPVDAAWKTYLKGLVEKYTGNGGWNPGRVTPDAGEPAIGQAAWAAMPLAVRNACTQSTANWYTNYENFQQVSGTRYFLNHYYHKPFTIGPVAAQAITATNDNYTAMSEMEFFANCYAEYFANPAGAKIHAQWGGTLPGNVKSFFKDVVLERNPYDKFQKKQKASPTGGGGGGGATT